MSDYAVSDEDCYESSDGGSDMQMAVTKKKTVVATARGKASAKNNDRAVEEIYQKKTQLEHILLRPDTYIGSVERQSQQMWVYDEAGECMVLKSLSFVPGLFKIFDEILVNAADNKIRDPNMDTLRVDIDKENGSISIFNNGAGIPVVIHKGEQVYVPELIFGQLLTSSNYDDAEKKVTGGRNGYGAKLCNIFSREFTVETADSNRGLLYKQTFSLNMSKRGEPKITKYDKQDFTRITFKPDFAKFGMEGFEADTEALFRKRVYDMCACAGNVKVFLNGERLKIKNFKQYAELFLKKPLAPGESSEAAVPAPILIHEKVSDRWEVCAAVSEGQFQQVSFVNSINTYKGGTHVDHVSSQIVGALVEAVKKKSKDMASIKPFQVKSHLSIFVNCLIENPTFDSQTKENMTLRQSAFGSKCELGEDFMKKVLKSGVLDNIMTWAKFKQDQALKKTDGAKRSRLSGIAKLDDANNAGTRNGQKCTLILTEGDSAKALAVSGLSVVGRDNYGVFPLRGKLLNVREASASQISANAEITHLKQILGLQQNKQYDSTESLRYGHVMIMTDQVKGSPINIHH
jgi:DNA topoisomerase-2